MEHIINKTYTETNFSEKEEYETLKFLNNFLLYYDKYKIKFDQVILTEKRNKSNNSAFDDFELEEKVEPIDLFGIWIKYFLLPKFIREKIETAQFAMETIRYIESYGNNEDLKLLKNQLRIDNKYIKLRKDLMKKSQYEKIIELFGESSKKIDFRFTTIKEAEQLLKNASIA